MLPGPPGAGGLVGDGGESNGTALTGPIPDISVDMPTPAAIAAAPAARLGFIALHSPRRLWAFKMLAGEYPANAVPNPETPPYDAVVSVTD